MLLVAVFLGKDATAVLLEVEAKSAGLCLTLAEADAKIAIEEFDTRESFELFTDGDELVVLLVWGDEESSSESVVAVVRGIADSLGEAFLITIVHAAVLEVTHDVLTEFVKAIFFVDDEVYVDGGGVVLETVTAGLVFDVRVDVWIVPKESRL